MQLVDTHTHIYLPEFDNDRDESINRAVRSGVVKLLMPNIDSESVEKMLDAENRYPGICYPMIGLHPTSVKENYKAELEKILSLAGNKKFYAVGEIGIDLYWDKTFVREQIAAFKEQVEYAIEQNMPVVVHSRDSFPEVFASLEDYRGTALKGVFHAFTGDLEDARKAIKMGFKLGIGGIVTFRNSGLDKTLKNLGPENVILETDSPYLAPVPFRGKRNESSYIPIINRTLAGIFGMDQEELAVMTYNSSAELFGI